LTGPAIAERRSIFHVDGLFSRVEAGTVGLWMLITVMVMIVFPPMFYLLQTSLLITDPPAEEVWGLGNYATVLGISGWDIWYVTLSYATGSSLVAIVLGVSSAWLVARTNAPFRQVAFVGAFLSMAAPVIIKGIGWILLLGPNQGVFNNWLRALFAIEAVPLDLFTLGGMIFIEGVLWTPIVFLLTLPPLISMDPALEEAAATSGARFYQTVRMVTLPLARPSIFAVLLLTFIRSLESFEVPLLIGTPGGLHTFTTAIFETIHQGFLPRYGEASAYATLLILVVIPPLVLYYRFTRESQKYATVTGKGYRPSQIDLGWWRIPCGLWLLIIPAALAAPLLILLWSSFLPIYTAPTWADFGRMTFENYWSVWNRVDTMSGLWNSTLVATASSTVTAAFTFVLAWIVIRRTESVKWVLDFIASLPLVFPGIVLGIAVLIQFLELRFIPIYGTIWILVFAFLIKYLPYGMRFCHAGILAVHQELEECARISGARTFRVLWAIVLPLTLPAVVAIWLYVFLHTIRDLSVAILLSGPENQVVSVVILDLWDNGEIPELGALSVVLAIAVTALGVVFMRLTRRQNYQS
jgi:iron(III) transport system permease protein